jgi:hypothetical protein
VIYTDALLDAMQRVYQGMQPPMPGLGAVIRLFAPMGEALAWIVALDDTLEGADGTYRARRNVHADGCLIRGLRYARPGATIRRRARLGGLLSDYSGTPIAA